MQQLVIAKSARHVHLYDRAIDPLFSQTKEAVTPEMFLPSDSRERHGATDALDYLRDYDLVPVVLDKVSGGHRHAIPRTIRLGLRYYQMTKGRKRLVDARLYFEDICTTQKPEHFGGSLHILDMMQEREIYPCEVDVNGNMKSQHYNLEIHYEALFWFELRECPRLCISRAQCSNSSSVLDTHNRNCQSIISSSRARFTSFSSR